MPRQSSDGASLVGASAIAIGPRTVLKKELHDAFAQGWDIDSIQPTKFETRTDLEGLTISEGVVCHRPKSGVNIAHRLRVFWMIEPRAGEGILSYRCRSTSLFHCSKSSKADIFVEHFNLAESNLTQHIQLKH